MERDRISELPDSLVAQILSYLPTRDSVKTSVLSKRWEFLWLKVSVLDLTAIKLSLSGVALSRLMNKYLEFNCGSFPQKFKIKCGQSQQFFRKESELHIFDFFQEIMKIKYSASTECNKRLVDWIAEVVHRGVQHLDVEAVMCETMQHYEIPHFAKDFIPKYVYVSKTLVSLKLVNVELEYPKFVVSLPRLKILHLKNIHYKYRGLSIIKMFISASPVLEDLTLDFPVSPQPENINLTMRPRDQCLISTLECVNINKLIMNDRNGIILVNYFHENSAVLKKLNLSLTHSSAEKHESESYEKLLTSIKLSPTCQVTID